MICFEHDFASHSGWDFILARMPWGRMQKTAAKGKTVETDFAYAKGGVISGGLVVEWKGGRLARI
jgi:hypothetical protein